MPVPVNASFRLLVGVTLLVTLVIGSASAEQMGEDRWVPSSALISGFTIHGERGKVTTINSAGKPIRPPTDGRDVGVSPFVGADLELMTPGLPIPLRPRLFLSGEIAATFAKGRDLATEGSATGVEGPVLPPPPPGQTLPGTGYPEQGFRGQGSRASSEMQALSYGAGFGVAIPFEWKDRQLRVKTSLEWTSFELHYDGVVMRGQCLVDPNDPNRTQCVRYQPPPPRPVVDGYTRIIELSAEGSQRYQALGPGLELELDTGRVGRLAHSLYLSARAYRVLGDITRRSITISDSKSFTDYLNPNPANPDVVRADWSYKIDPWMYRVVLGFRFSFVGTDG